MIPGKISNSVNVYHLKYVQVFLVTWTVEGHVFAEQNTIFRIISMNYQNITWSKNDQFLGGLPSQEWRSSITTRMSKILPLCVIAL